MAFEAEKLPHEKPDVDAWRVLPLVFGFLAFTALLVALLGFYYRFRVSAGSLREPYRPYPAPQLQPNPEADYQNFLRAQREQLTGTRWVDADRKLIHVPIERAMALVAGKGNAAYDPLAPATGQKPPPTPQDGQIRATPAGPVAPYGDHP